MAAIARGASWQGLHPGQTLQTLSHLPKFGKVPKPGQLLPHQVPGWVKISPLREGRPLLPDGSSDSGTLPTSSAVSTNTWRTKYVE